MSIDGTALLAIGLLVGQVVGTLLGGAAVLVSAHEQIDRAFAG